MNRKAAWLIISSVLLFFSCSEQGQESRILLSPIKTIHFNTSSLFELVFANDSVLFASTLNSPQKMLILSTDQDDDREAKFILNEGRGPNDVSNVLFKVKDDTLHVLSYSPYGIEKSIRISVDQILDMTTWIVEQCPQFKGIQVSLGFDVTDRGDYLLTGDYFEKANVLSKINIVTKQYEALGFWPEDDFSSNNIVKQLVYLGGAKIYSNGSNLLYVCGDGHYAVVGEINGKNRFVQQAEILKDKPSYTAAADGINVKRDPKNAVGTYSYATEENIFLSPISSKIVNGQYVPVHYKGYPAYYTDNIDIYAWDGTYRTSLKLERPFCNFIVETEGKKIYALGMDLNTSEQIVDVYTYSGMLED